MPDKQRTPTRHKVGIGQPPIGYRLAVEDDAFTVVSQGLSPSGLAERILQVSFPVFHLDPDDMLAAFTGGKGTRPLHERLKAVETPPLVQLKRLAQRSAFDTRVPRIPSVVA